MMLLDQQAAKACTGSGLGCMQATPVTTYHHHPHTCRQHVTAACFRGRPGRQHNNALSGHMLLGRPCCVLCHTAPTCALSRSALSVQPTQLRHGSTNPRSSHAHSLCIAAIKSGITCCCTWAHQSAPVLPHIRQQLPLRGAGLPALPAAAATSAATCCRQPQLGLGAGAGAAHDCSSLLLMLLLMLAPMPALLSVNRPAPPPAAAPSVHRQLCCCCQRLLTRQPRHALTAHPCCAPLQQWLSHP